LEAFEVEAQRRFEEADTEAEPTPTAELLAIEAEQRRLIAEREARGDVPRALEPEPTDVLRGGGGVVPQPSPEQFFRGLIGTTPRQQAADRRRREREASQERVAQLLAQAGSVSNKTTRHLQQTKRR